MYAGRSTAGLDQELRSGQLRRQEGLRSSVNVGL